MIFACIRYELLPDRDLFDPILGWAKDGLLASVFPVSIQLFDFYAMIPL